MTPEQSVLHLVHVRIDSLTRTLTGLHEVIVKAEPFLPPALHEALVAGVTGYLDECQELAERNNALRAPLECVPGDVLDHRDDSLMLEQHIEGFIRASLASLRKEIPAW